MALPPHIDSFRKFNDAIPNDHLTASVAFGLFMQSERMWVDRQNPEPTETKCRNYHQSYLTDHEIGRYKQAAEHLLTEYANQIVETKRPEFLEQSLSNYKIAASEGHRGFRGWGTVEATVGALFWSIILVVFFVIVIFVRGGDIFETWRRAIGALSGNAS
jgi:hypothetical protein